MVPHPRRAWPRASHLYRAFLRPRLRLRDHPIVARAARASGLDGGAPDADPALRGMVGLDLYHLGRQLARPRTRHCPADADPADACRARAVERDSLRLRRARLDVRRRLLHDAAPPVAIPALGNVGAASGPRLTTPAPCFLHVPVAAA